MALLKNITENVFKGVNVISDQIRSSLSLLMYLHKTINKGKNKKTEETTTREMPPSLNIPTPIKETKIQKKSRQKKTEIVNTPQEESADTPLKNNISVVTESLTQDQQKRHPFLTKKMLLIICLILCLGFMLMIGWRYISPSSSTHHQSKTHNQTRNVFNDQLIQKNTKSSLQPPLDQKQAKGFMSTINPHFLTDSPLPLPHGTSSQSVAIIVFGLGINQDETDKILSHLPEEISLAISPYTINIEELIADSKQMGHRILLQMPWEDEDIYTDLGKYTLRIQQNKEELIENLNNLTQMAEKTDGFYVVGGSRLMRSPPDLKTVLHYITNNKNCLIAPPDVLTNQLHHVSDEVGINYVSTTLINPDIKDFPLIDSLAKRTGFAILAFESSDNLSENIMNWINKLEAAKLNVVPINQIIKIQDPPLPTKANK